MRAIAQHHVEQDARLKSGEAAEAALVDGRFPEAQRDFEEAIAECRARGDIVGAGEAMVRLARTYWFRGETDRKRTLLAQAVELLTPLAERGNAGAQLKHGII